MRKRSLEFLADSSLIFISIIWGSTFIIVKETIKHIDVFSFLTLRFGLASLIMTFFILKKFKDIINALKHGIILGIILFLTFAFQTFGLKYTLASIAGFLTGLYVIFVPILSVFFLKVFPRKTSILGAIFAFLGLALISYNGGNFEVNKGLLLLIANAFCIGLHIILIDKYSKMYDVICLTFIQLITVFLFSFIFSLIFKTDLFSVSFSSNLIFALVITGIFATVVAFFVQTAMQKYTTPTKAAIIFTVEPVSAAIFSYILGGETLSFQQYIGSAIIITSIIISEAGSIIIDKRDKYD